MLFQFSKVPSIGFDFWLNSCSAYCISAILCFYAKILFGGYQTCFYNTNRARTESASLIYNEPLDWSYLEGRTWDVIFDLNPECAQKDIFMQATVKTHPYQVLRINFSDTKYAKTPEVKTMKIKVNNIVKVIR